MLYNFIDDLKTHGISLNGVLHVGAHDGGELNSYITNNISNIAFVEANPEIYKRLVERCSEHKNITIRTYNVGISDKKKTDVPFYITNNDSASSSILKLKEHMFEYPNISVTQKINIETNTIDELLKENNLDASHFNVLNMDIQGAEMYALLGAKNYLQKCDAVYLEVNFREMYKDCGLITDIDSYLGIYNFERIKLIDTGRGWGDALYIKNKD